MTFPGGIAPACEETRVRSLIDVARQMKRVQRFGEMTPVSSSRMGLPSLADSARVLQFKSQ